MPGASPAVPASPREILKRVWGYDSFRPLQREAIEAALAGRDSLVVLPTGGGKSLCYQLPALARPGWTLVVSPLISLMEDQVAALRAQGVAAGCVHSGSTEGERRRVRRLFRSGELKLLHVSPERLLTPRFLAFLDRTPPDAIAIDEAHCISTWGHDFRPEYRRLAEVRQRLARVPFHGFTATATERVRRDIAAQLGLRNPAMLVGPFDRPNLTYRADPRGDVAAQVLEVADRHGGAGIVYTISRRETERLAGRLRSAGVEARPYHAGLSDEERREAEVAFQEDTCRVIVATVAFGMGIDKPGVRFVAHAALPKSVEHYMQESGRAGRDGLPAECALFWKQGDVAKWRQLLAPPEGEGEAEEEVHDRQVRQLEQMARYAATTSCRHAALAAHFGQHLPDEPCGACDNCNEEVELLPESEEVALLLLRAVRETGEIFGGVHLAEVLRGSESRKVKKFRHDELPTHGSLARYAAADLRAWTDQLVEEGLLAVTRKRGFALTVEGAEALEGQRCSARLRAPRTPEPLRRPVRGGGEAELSPREEELFEALRDLRRDLARREGVPPYVIFHDRSLREMARRAPTSPASLRRIGGVGEEKLRRWGRPFLALIGEYGDRAAG